MDQKKDNTALSRTLASTETLRLVELRTVDAFYTPLEERFERLTRLGRASLGLRVVAVTVIDHGRQWFKSVNGWKVNELPLERSLCQRTVAEGRVVLVPDAQADPQYADHPMVGNAPGFRFYVGAPLRDHGGEIIGTFCAMDTEPREFGDEQLQCFLDLASMAERELFTSELWEGYGAMISKLGAARREAMFDPLTRLWNRRGGIAMLGMALKDLRSSDAGLAVCIGDIDKFKRVNDLYGHQAGDHVLRGIAQVMVSHLRPRDIICRLGGDEFLLVLLGATEAQLREIAGRLKETLSGQRIKTRAGAFTISMSLGGVAYPAGSDVSPETALEEADKALYNSKRGGRNRLSLAATS